jgi:hypothetical protein
MGQDFLGILKNPPFDVEIKIALVMLFFKSALLFLKRLMGKLSSLQQATRIQMK